MPSPLRIAFLGCGFITRVHSRNLRRFQSEIVCGYASRDKTKAAAFCGEFRGTGSYADYADAINDPNVDAVVIAVPPKFHLNLTLQALSAGKHVLVEKPAYPTTGDYHVVREARDKAKRVVLVGENDHYKPLAIKLRQLLADGVIGDMVFGQFSSIVKRLRHRMTGATTSRWRAGMHSSRKASTGCTLPRALGRKSARSAAIARPPRGKDPIRGSRA